MTDETKFSRAVVRRVMSQRAKSHVDRVTGELSLTFLVEDVADRLDIDLGDDSTDWIWDHAIKVADSLRGKDNE